MQISVLYQEKKYVLKAVSGSCIRFSLGVRGIYSSGNFACLAGRDGAGWKAAEPIMPKDEFFRWRPLRVFLRTFSPRKPSRTMDASLGLWDTCAALRPTPRNAWKILTIFDNLWWGSPG